MSNGRTQTSLHLEIADHITLLEKTCSPVDMAHELSRREYQKLSDRASLMAEHSAIISNRLKQLIVLEKEGR